MLDTSILLVEDDWSDEELLKRQFRLNHVLNQLFVVRDGEEAMDYLRGRQRYRGRDTAVLSGLVLLDLQLPKLSGTEVLKQLRAAPLAEPPVIVALLNGPVEGAATREVLKLGARGCLKKPLSFAALRELTERLGFQWLGMEEKVISPPPFRQFKDASTR